MTALTPNPPIPRQCFAASNSCEGFKNYYGDIFTDTRVDRLYIIKGGPGTGKSHFMRVVARRARERGYIVTEFGNNRAEPHGADETAVIPSSPPVETTGCVGRNLRRCSATQMGPTPGPPPP